jgi:hypothetical protein
MASHGPLESRPTADERYGQTSQRAGKYQLDGSGSPMLAESSPKSGRPQAARQRFDVFLEQVEGELSQTKNQPQAAQVVSRPRRGLSGKGRNPAALPHGVPQLLEATGQGAQRSEP